MHIIRENIRETEGCTVAKKLPYDGILVENARLAVSAELKRKRVLNKPIAEFDPKDGKVYLVYSDGRNEAVGNAMQRGRYSERCKEKA